MKLNDLIKFKALSLRNSLDGGIDDRMLAHVPKDQIKDHTRNVCALISTKLFEDLEHTCAFLGMSKRLFIEAAIAHAVEQANMEIAPLEELAAEISMQHQEAA